VKLACSKKSGNKESEDVSRSVTVKNIGRSG